MATSTSPRRERPAFFDGQQLEAGDLQDLESYGSELRWLHNRSLHQPGIGNGFAVAGERGDREVVVGAGYALDVDGREIVLTTEERQPVPAVASEPDGRSVFFDLTIAYADEDDLKPAETRAGVCLPGGAVRRLEAPRFCWVRLKRDDQGKPLPEDAALGRDVEQGRRIRLARVEVLNCELRAPVSIDQRREARPPKLPYVVAGITTPERDGTWTSVTDQLTAAEANIDWKTLVGEEETKVEKAVDHFMEGFFAFTRSVNTCAAGFESTPWYTAQIVGPRIVGPPADEGQAGTFLLVEQVHVQSATPGSFTAFLLVSILRIRRPSDGEGGNVEKESCDPEQNFKDLAAVADWIQRCWQLSWMGVEP